MKPTLFLLVLLLSACAPVFAPAAAAPTLTPAPTRISTLTPTITLTPTPFLPIADPDLAAALKAHPGLEASITRETDGRFTAQVALLSPDGAAAPAAVDASAPPVSPPEGTVASEVTVPSVPEATATLAPTEAALPVATSRGPELHATDPTTVALASGGLQLVEFFRFT